MDSFEEQVNAILESHRTVDPAMLTEAVDALLERPKVSYWRTVKSGHKVGFKGQPGKGKPVTGNPKVMKRMKGGSKK